MYRAFMSITLLLVLVCCSKSSNPTRFYFIHIPKTGGTSLHSVLENQMDLKDLYPPRRFQKVDQPVAHEYVSGHFPFWFCKQLDKEFEQAFKVTILRDPIERYLSLLRYKKKNFSELNHLSLEEVYEKIQNHVELLAEAEPNKMCSFLTSDPNLTGKDLLESAKANLHRFDFVLFLDNFQEDMQILCELIGIEFDRNALPHLNTTVKETNISPELIAIIKKNQDLDIELYEYAKKYLTHKKNRSYRFASKTKSSHKKVSKIDYTFSMPLNGTHWCYRENVDRFSPEYPIYRWVMDKPAKIRFPLIKKGNYSLTFMAQLLTPTLFPHVLVNGVEIPVERKNFELFSRFQCKIPASLISDGFTEFTFYSTQSHKYNEIYPGYSDDRKLCFAMNRIKISPLSKRRSASIQEQYRLPAISTIAE